MLWAWKKAKKAFSIGDIWYCDYQLCQFEANLDSEIKSLIAEVNESRYKMKDLQIAPFPKGYDEKENKAQTRQAFYISVRDQVLWLAVCNIIGPMLDERMATWSYGNRLYRPAWYERSEEEQQIVVGNYRNSNGFIFRKWKQSWPLFRKHITATLKVMADPSIINKKSKEGDFDVQKTIEDNLKMESIQQLPYLLNGYFPHKKVNCIYWASLDFKKFYPSIKISKIRDIILSILNITHSNSPELFTLINSLFDFKIDYKPWNKSELEAINLSLLNNFEGLPTGLLAAGFLANVALLNIDRVITDKLNENKNIAHFRFVDDHVILSTDFDKLITWINEYQKILAQSEIGAIIGHDKTEPKNLSDFLTNKNEDIDSEEYQKKYNLVKKSCSLDPEYPSPLMTQTLAKVSAISKMELDLLSNDELEQLISDLKHLLITDFPDQEVKKETRISFAATMLSKTVSRKEYDYHGIYNEKNKLYRLKKDINQGLESKRKQLETIKLAKSCINGIDQILNTFLTTQNISKLINNLPIKHPIEPGSISYRYLKSLEQIKSILENIYADKNNLNIQVYNLIKKAIKENHQKVRLWIRFVQFCYNEDFYKYSDIWDLIGELKKDNKIHKLSSAFIYYMYVAIIIELIWKSIRLILINKMTAAEHYKHMGFLKYICSTNFVSMILKKESFDKRDNYQSIFIQFKVVLGSIQFILNENNPEHFKTNNILDWTDRPTKWIEGQRLNNINTWLFWIFNNSHTFEQEIPYGFWPKLLLYVNAETVEDVKPLVTPFPYENIVKSINENNPDFDMILPSLIDSQGWLFDYYRTIKNNETKKAAFKENLKRHRELYNNIQKEKKRKTLYDWILLLENGKHEPDDLRFSEWTVLSFVLKIVDAIREHRNQKRNSIHSLFNENFNPDIYIHPSNIHIPLSLFNNFPKTWNDLEFKMRKTTFKIRPQEEQIRDERYQASSLNTKFYDKDISTLYGISIIMIQLFCKKTSFPWVWNLSDRNLIWSKVITKQLTENAISSFSQLIVQSCLSSRNRETLLFNSRSIHVNDTTYDPPIIHSLNKLSEEITKTLNILKRNQISVENNSPRQLTPISLIWLSNKNNPFKENNNE